MLAISAALAAFLGVRARIRQIRLISTSCMGAAGPSLDSGIPSAARLGDVVKTENHNRQQDIRS